MLSEDVDVGFRIITGDLVCQDAVVKYYRDLGDMGLVRVCSWCMEYGCVSCSAAGHNLPYPMPRRMHKRISTQHVYGTVTDRDENLTGLGVFHAMSLAEQYDEQIRQFSAELLARECALVEVGRVSARRFDDGHDPAGSRVQRVLTELRKLAERWDRLTLLPPAPEQEPELSDLDQLRARRAQRVNGA